MTEATIRGLIQGGAFALIATLAILVWKLMRSKSEGARRLKWVAGIGGGALLVAFLSGGNPADAAAIVVAIGVGVWIYLGFKKSP